MVSRMTYSKNQGAQCTCKRTVKKASNRNKAKNEVSKNPFKNSLFFTNIKSSFVEWWKKLSIRDILLYIVIKFKRFAFI